MHIICYVVEILYFIILTFRVLFILKFNIDLKQICIKACGIFLSTLLFDIKSMLCLRVSEKKNLVHCDTVNEWEIFINGHPGAPEQ